MPSHDRDERVSLHGHDPELVLRALLRVPLAREDKCEDETEPLVSPAAEQEKREREVLHGSE